MKSDDIIICSCCSIEHQIIFRTINDEKFDGNVFVHIHLSNYRSFFKRLLRGIKYIFGYKSKYGDWDEFILDETHIEKLEEIIKKIKCETT